MKRPAAKLVRTCVAIVEQKVSRIDGLGDVDQKT